MVVCSHLTFCVWQVFEAGVVLADGEFSGLESVILGAPVEMTNNYLNAVAYNEVSCAFYVDTLGC